MPKTNKNNMISFWRVVFSYLIILLHLFNQYFHITGWTIGVEFFFVVSGWLLAADLKKKDRTPYGYTWHRIKRLYPEYFLSFLVSGIFFLVFNGFSAKDSLFWFETVGFRELLLIHYWPWQETQIANVVTWYVSILVLAGLLLYSLCKRLPDITREIIIPLVIIIGLTFSYRVTGSLVTDYYGDFIYSQKFMRGFMEMGIGILLFDFNEKYSEYLKNKVVQWIGFLMLLFTAISSYFYAGKVEYFHLLLISIGVAIAFNTKLPFESKLLAFLDKISYSIFLNHVIFRAYIMPKYFESLSAKVIVIYIIAVTAFSIVMYYLSRLMIVGIRKLQNA
ncbi:Peptidoglycan/LPS O-acetylase OafA/YrhL, contains acyltransferase and SGNH-hydrolase domains [Pseudobutyrivibrio sp. UC1225]|uniref:acyltransferase family protein n=1 Tax=Pseudobutyrivibrio sp. UC1225 TaxID=1798185 RepID=UPI0008DF9D89|nr:acyltransferase [Pseudobutyrivibrio sp. UC1225]SFN58537.1 Peptidoglycan/LPS O-acetylase OafA/YrhL, contains acyltransferase and SGNH-hydrolase domains [Pseudobutyrivibrio sp. UC1225]